MSIIPIRRDMKMSFPKEKINDWHERGRHHTHFFNALSLFFPAGERFFIDSVRHYKDNIEDTELRKAVIGFIGQEAMHSREHIEYNKAIEESGLPAAKIEGNIQKLLNFVKKYRPAKSQLATTIALEHYTAILANVLLSNPKVLGNSNPDYMKIWTWHALEETEHKAVAYDVWNEVTKPNLYHYLLRCTLMVLVSITFWTQVITYHIKLVKNDPHCAHNKIRGFGSVFNFFWGFKGVFWKMLPELFAYFKPNFHPWQQDNKQYLKQLETINQDGYLDYRVKNV